VVVRLRAKRPPFRIKQRKAGEARSARRDRLSIVIAASEGAPYSKTGGLGDVIGALPGALAALGHDVSVFLPYYAATRRMRPPTKRTGVTVAIPMRATPVEARILRLNHAGRPRVYFVERDAYYDRDGLYQGLDGDYPDNAERFMFFSRAVAAAVKKLGLRPDIIHCHDWQTGLIPALARHGKERRHLASSATVFTVHNLAFQGLFWHFDMEMTGLPWSTFTPDGLEFYGKINLLKAGLVYSDVTNTVSRKYSHEIQTEEFGCGLDGVLGARAKNVFGILNGADSDNWDPATDRHLAANYSANDMSGKKQCRRNLLQAYGLNVPDGVPVVGMVGRLTDQKGLDILTEVLDEIVGLGVCFILVGTGEEEYHQALERCAAKHPGRVGVRLGFDNALAHKIEAGADMFLMPSRFEPCGLNQMYSLRYGTVPIVRATGGLDDTITNFDPLSGQGNGLKFTAYSGRALLNCVRRGVRLFKDRRAWSRLVANGMQCDFSWDASARHYVRLYRTAIDRHTAAGAKR